MTETPFKGGLDPRRLFYGWWIALAGAGTNFIVLSVTIFGFGVFIGYFQEEYGWSVRAIALGFSLRNLQQGLLSPLTGYFVDRLGPRRVAVAGIILVATSLFAFSQARSLPLYYGASVAMALGQSLGGFGAFSLALMRWFVKNRGKATAIMNSGNGLAYLAPLIVIALISAMGFHGTLIFLGVVVLVLGIPLALVIRDQPEAYGLLPDGDVASGPDPGGLAATARLRAAGGYEIREVLRMPAFYLLILAGAAGGTAQSAWVTFQIPHMQAQGFSLGLIGALSAAYGIAQMPARMLGGWVGDRIGRHRAYTASIGLHALGLVCFAFLSPERIWIFPAYYAIFGIGHAIWITNLQAVTADYFGTKRYGTIRGLSFALQAPFTVLTPLFLGSMFDVHKNYQLAYLILAATNITGVLWMLLIRRKTWIEKPAPGSAPSTINR